MKWVYVLIGIIGFSVSIAMLKDCYYHRDDPYVNMGFEGKKRTIAVIHHFFWAISLMIGCIIGVILIVFTME